MLLCLPQRAGMAELADAADSKSADLRVLGVRLPLPAPRRMPHHLVGFPSFIFFALFQSRGRVLQVRRATLDDLFHFTHGTAPDFEKLAQVSATFAFGGNVKLRTYQCRGYRLTKIQDSISVHQVRAQSTNSEYRQSLDIETR